MAKIEKESSKRAYVAVNNFNNDIFSYGVSMNTQMVKVGKLSPLSTATVSTCPKGHILRETGRKLFPGANSGVSTLMVSVFDNQTMLNGFINPNSPLFEIYSTDLPTFFKDSVNPGPLGMTDHGPPVFTNSTVEALQTVTAGTGLTVTTGNATVMDGNIYVSNGGVNVSNGNIVLSNGAFRIPTSILSTASMVASVPPNNYIEDVGTNYRKCHISSPGCTANSRIFLTYNGVAYPGILSAENMSNGGSFTIVSTNYLDRSRVQYLIMN